MIATPKNIWFHITTSKLGPDLIAKKTINGTAEQLKNIVFNTKEKNYIVIKEALEFTGSTLITDNENTQTTIKPAACSLRRITTKEDLKTLPEYLNALTNTDKLNEKSYTCTENITERAIVICHIAAYNTHLIEIDEKVANQTTTNLQLEQEMKNFQGNGNLGNLARTCLSLFILKTAGEGQAREHINHLNEISLLAHYFFE